MKKAQVAADPLAHNPLVYLRQAKYFSGTGDHVNTLLYLSLALDANSEEQDIGIGTDIMATQAISLAKLGDFDLSMRSAEAVLTLDPICLEAIWIKAESLYNSCDFEHAMAVFSHGLRISPGFEGFTTGVAKVGGALLKINISIIRFSVGRPSGTPCISLMFLTSPGPLCCSVNCDGIFARTLTPSRG